MDVSSTSYPFKMFPLLSGSALKIIAVLSMVTDHCAYYLLDESSVTYEVMRCFGRIAFPMFAFLVAKDLPIPATGCDTSFPSCCSLSSAKCRGIC